ncbi:MAG TPA: SpoIID/LytB domain-containing protein [Clostridia bacterium]|nr:SpoIID/LytB domain-containing protein [Clostridia bacterium]
MRRLFILALALAFSLSTFMLSGCRAQEQRPKGAPSEEPNISLFINDTGEKKDIAFEEYLMGVVAAEMEPTWPENALAAQAILARTFTMENIDAGRVRDLHGTDASTSVEEFQAYDPTRINDNVRTAVETTRGQVVTSDGRYIKAWFSASCGGITATPEEGLNFTEEPVPYIKSQVKDPGISITVPENRGWEKAIPAAQVCQAINDITGSDPGDLASVKVEEWGPSGRAQKIRFNDQVVAGPEFRIAVGSEMLRSTFLTGEPRIDGDNVVFEGKGFGHGVGMCQWGANKLARDGKTPEEIINFYFQNVQIQKLWS